MSPVQGRRKKKEKKNSYYCRSSRSLTSANILPCLSVTYGLTHQFCGLKSTKVTKPTTTVIHKKKKNSPSSCLKLELEIKNTAQQYFRCG